MEADREMDAGAIWAHKSFPMRTATKSSLFNREVTQAAVDCLWETLIYMDAADFKPEPLDYDRQDVKGCLRPTMKPITQFAVQLAMVRYGLAISSPSSLMATALNYRQFWR